MFAFLRRARKSLTRFALAGSVVALAACDPGAFTLPGGSGQRIDSGEPVQVALLVPAGSATDGDNIVAQSLENAARLAVADLGNANIDLRVYPTGGDANQAAIAATNAVNDGAKIILGPLYAQNAAAAGVAAAKKNVNVLAFSNNTAVAGGNVFVLGPTFQNTANRLASYAASRGKSAAVVVHGQSPAEEIGADAIARAMANVGGTVVATESFEMSQQGIVQATKSIANTVKNSGANALFLASGNDGALPFLAQLLPENGAGPDRIQWLGLQRWDIPASAVTLPGLQGGWFAVPDRAMAANFSQRYNSTYGQPPLPTAGLAYDGIAAIGALIQSGDPDALTTTGLTRASGFAGVNGIFRLLPDGTNERGLSIATIQNNQVIEIDPAPRRFGGAGF
ncbi:penicillin-binding protein activator [Aliiroseovarius sp. PTFE2010]|uniref:penicillin-binding protein activator n=1 Tax=Aliiroseovarius sp. PTFE2010 TaxID=3417190 RepID=UPI003CF0C1AE